jgi:hypothetical protein
LVVHFIKEADPRVAGRPKVDGPAWRPKSGKPPWLLGGPADPRQPTAIDDPPGLLRHGQLRHRLRHQCYELEDFRAKDPEAAWAVLGIDAAAQEGHTAPAVMAPAFRFLRRRLPASGLSASGLSADPASTAGWAPPLRATYHVGESFHDPITGLRTTHEAIRFLDLRPGDRLGHAMVLGIDARRWLENCGPPPHMTREERFDNLVWMAQLLRERRLEHLLPRDFDSLVAEEFEALYGREPVPTPRSLTELLGWAWQLRWMDPRELFAVLWRRGWRGGWPSCDPDVETGGSEGKERPGRQDYVHPLAGGLRSCLRAGRCLRCGPRGEPAPLGRELCAPCREGQWSRSPVVLDPALSPRRLAWRLSTLDLDLLFSGKVPVAALRYLWCHQFDRRVYRRGREAVPWPEDFPDRFELFEPLREAVLAEVANRDLTIEVCPTSNLVIGGFGDLEHHPVFHFDTHGLKTTEEHALRVMINSDDPGIFATNLPSEYAALAWAAERKGEAPADVMRWIGHLRKRGVHGTFLHKEGVAAHFPEDVCWPPNLALYPEWRDASWRKLALALEDRCERERMIARLRRLLTTP